jgi:hypothetical protein
MALLLVRGALVAALVWFDFAEGWRVGNDTNATEANRIEANKHTRIGAPRLGDDSMPLLLRLNAATIERNN